MQAKELAFHGRSQGEEIKHVCKGLPDRAGSVLAQALIVKAIDLGNLPALVVAAQQCNSTGVPDLERQQEADDLDGVVAAVDVVYMEEVVGVGDLSSQFEQLD